MVQKTRKTLGFKKIMVYKTPTARGEGKPYLATGLCGYSLESPCDCELDSTCEYRFKLNTFFFLTTRLYDITEENFMHAALKLLNEIT